MWNDVKFACRSLLKQPLFSFMIVSILAIGIAGTTTVFSLFNGLFLRRLPVPAQKRVVNLREKDPMTGEGGLSYPRFHAWREHNRTFETMSVCASWIGNLAVKDTVERVSICLATHDIFDVLGVQPVLGRRFTVQEDRPGAPKVVLLSFGLWERLFAEDPTVLGRTLSLDDDSCYTVIGVLPRDATFPMDKDIWCPLRPDPEKGHGGLGPMALGRLKKGVTVEQAQADLERIQEGWAEQHPEREVTGMPVVTPLQVWYLEMIAQLRTGVLVLLGVGGFVLLIACCNVASTMLTRGSYRSQEIAVRSALGATHARIIQQVLVECLVLSIIGGLLGLLLGHFALKIVLAYIGNVVPSWMVFEPDIRCILFTVAIVGLTTVLSGLLPAVQAAFTKNIHGILGILSGRTTVSRTQRRALSTIVVLQISLALTLLVGASLILQTFRRVNQVEPGFRTAGILTYHIPLPIGPYLDENRRHAFWEQHIEQVRSLPGVLDAALVNNLPLSIPAVKRFEVEGAAPTDDAGEDTQTLVRRVTPGYFRTLGVRLLSGRVFTEKDNRLDGELTVIVNESFAKRYWPDQNPVDRRVCLEGKEDWMRVIGVVGDIRQLGLDQQTWPGVYLPRVTDAAFAMYGVVRTSGDPLSLGAAVRGAVHSIDRGLPVDHVQLMSERVQESLKGRRLNLWLYGVPAVTAVVMALTGIYGVTSYAVSQRIHEIGIRMALGARAGDVIKMVLVQGLGLIAVGLGMGMVGAFILSRLLASIPNMLHSVAPTDPATFVGIPLSLAAVALVACFIPARRAARIDPMLALKCE
jgi:putative ABC transport system permease protein